GSERRWLFRGCEMSPWRLRRDVWQEEAGTMRILYFTQFFSPENIAGAFRARDHAVAWAEKGHDVTVFTGWPNYPAGKLFDGYVMERLGEESVDGVRVFRSQSKMQANTSFKKRIESGLSFVANGLRNTRGDSPIGKDY